MEKTLTNAEVYNLLKMGTADMHLYGDDAAVMKSIRHDPCMLACCATEWTAMTRNCVGLKTLMEDGDEKVKEYLANCKAFVLFEFEKLSAKQFDEIIGLALSVDPKPRIILVGDLLTRISCPANDMTSPVQSECWKKLKLDTVRVPVSKVDEEYRQAVDLISRGDFKGAEWLNNNCCKECPEDAVQIVTSKSEAEDIKKENEPPHQRTSGGYDSWDDPYGSKAWGFLKAGIYDQINKDECAISDYMPIFMGEQIMTVADPNCEEFCSFEAEIGKANPYIDDNGILRILGLKSGRFAVWKRSRVKHHINEYGIGEFRYETIGMFKRMNILPTHAVSLWQVELMTFNSICIDPTTTMPGELASLLSRCRSVKGLYLTRPMKEEDIKVDAEIVKAIS